jgi:hypothetical protein
MLDGSWLMAQGSWLMAKGSQGRLVSFTTTPTQARKHGKTVLGQIRYKNQNRTPKHMFEKKLARKGKQIKEYAKQRFLGKSGKSTVEKQPTTFLKRRKETPLPNNARREMQQRLVNPGILHAVVAIFFYLHLL